MVKPHEKCCCLLVVLLFVSAMVHPATGEMNLTISVPKDRIVSGEPLAFELALEMNAETEPPFPSVEFTIDNRRHGTPYEMLAQGEKPAFRRDGNRFVHRFLGYILLDLGDKQLPLLEPGVYSLKAIADGQESNALAITVEETSFAEARDMFCRKEVAVSIHMGRALPEAKALMREIVQKAPESIYGIYAGFFVLQEDEKGIVPRHTATKEEVLEVWQRKAALAFRYEAIARALPDPSLLREKALFGAAKLHCLVKRVDEAKKDALEIIEKYPPSEIRKNAESMVEEINGVLARSKSNGKEPPQSKP